MSRVLGERAEVRGCLRDVMHWDATAKPRANMSRAFCDKVSCVNRTRCRPPLRIFAHTAQSLPSYFKPFVSPPNLTDFSPEQREMFTDDPTRACVFWVRVDGVHSVSHAKKISTWGADGSNHLIQPINRLADRGITLRERNRFLRRAAVAQGHATAERFVHGLDIALTLYPKVVISPELLKALTADPRAQRKYLFTSKGTLTSHPCGLLAMHTNPVRRIVLSSQIDFHHRAKKGDSAAAIACKAVTLGSKFRSWDYIDLLNATFGAVRPGLSPATYRLMEVMKAGMIPVFFGFEDVIRPYDELIRWSEFSFTVPSDVDLDGVLFPWLEEVERNVERVARMRTRMAEVYAEWLDNTKGSGERGILETLHRRFEMMESDERPKSRQLLSSSTEHLLVQRRET
jgi:hypothetical protein